MISEKNVGQRIRELRTSLGLTLEELADKTGFTKGYLSRVENSKKAPPVATLIRIATALEVTLSDIFEEQKSRTTCPWSSAESAGPWPVRVRFRLLLRNPDPQLRHQIHAPLHHDQAPEREETGPVPAQGRGDDLHAGGDDEILCGRPGVPPGGGGTAFISTATTSTTAWPWATATSRPCSLSSPPRAGNNPAPARLLRIAAEALTGLAAGNHAGDT